MMIPTSGVLALMVCPLQSRVMLSDAMIALPKWSSARIVSVVRLSVPELAETGMGNRRSEKIGMTIARNAYFTMTNLTGKVVPQ